MRADKTVGDNVSAFCAAEIPRVAIGNPAVGEQAGRLTQNRMVIILRTGNGAVKIALALAEAFDCGVNDLPLTLVLSWYEQKAVCILLTLLSLGIKNIYLGPTLPAFVSKGVLDVLVDKFQLTPISTPEEDIKRILG